MGYSIDLTKYNLNKGIKYIIFIILIYFILTHQLDVLIYCVIISILFILLDNYFPSCKLV